MLATFSTAQSTAPEHQTGKLENAHHKKKR